jgi:hypothetical protein
LKEAIRISHNSRRTTNRTGPDEHEEIALDELYNFCFSGIRGINGVGDASQLQDEA